MPINPYTALHRSPRHQLQRIRSFRTTCCPPCPRVQSSPPTLTPLFRRSLFSVNQLRRGFAYTRPQRSDLEDEIYQVIRHQLDDPTLNDSSRTRHSPHLTRITVPTHPLAGSNEPASTTSTPRPVEEPLVHTVLSSILQEPPSPKPHPRRLAHLVQTKVNRLGVFLDEKIETSTAAFETRTLKALNQLDPRNPERHTTPPVVTPTPTVTSHTPPQSGGVYRFLDTRLNQLEEYLDSKDTSHPLRLNYINDRYFSKVIKHNNLERQFLNRVEPDQELSHLSGDLGWKSQPGPAPRNGPLPDPHMEPSPPQSPPPSHLSTEGVVDHPSKECELKGTPVPPGLESSPPHPPSVISILKHAEGASDSHVRFNRALQGVASSISTSASPYLSRILAHYHKPLAGKLSSEVLLTFCQTLLRLNDWALCVKHCEAQLSPAEVPPFLYRLLVDEGTSRAPLQLSRLNAIFGVLQCLGLLERRNHVRATWMLMDSSDDANLVHILEHDIAALDGELEFSLAYGEVTGGEPPVSLKGGFATRNAPVARSQFEVMHAFYERLRLHYDIRFNELIDMHNPLHRDDFVSRDNWLRLTIPFRVQLLVTYLHLFSSGYADGAEMALEHDESIQTGFDHTKTIVLDIYINDPDLKRCEGVLSALLRAMSPAKQPLEMKVSESSGGSKCFVDYASLISQLSENRALLTLSTKDLTELVTIQVFSKRPAECVPLFLAFVKAHGPPPSLVISHQFRQCQRLGILPQVLTEANEHLAHLDGATMGHILLAGYTEHLKLLPSQGGSQAPSAESERLLCVVKTTLARVAEKDTTRVVDFVMARLTRPGKDGRLQKFSHLTLFTSLLGRPYTFSDRLFDEFVFSYVYKKRLRHTLKDAWFYANHFSLDQQFRMMVSFTNTHLANKQAEFLDTTLAMIIFQHVCAPDPARQEANRALYEQKLQALSDKLVTVPIAAKPGLLAEGIPPKVAVYQDMYNQKLHSLVNPMGDIRHLMSRLASVIFCSLNKACAGPISKPVSPNPRDHLVGYRENVREDILDNTTVKVTPSAVVNPDISEAIRVLNLVFDSYGASPLGMYKYTVLFERLVGLYMDQDQCELAYALTERVTHCPVEARALVLRRLASINPQATRATINKIMAAESQTALSPEMFHAMCLGVMDSPHLDVTIKHHFYRKLCQKGMVPTRHMARQYLVAQVNIHLQSALERGKGSLSRFNSFMRKAADLGVDEKFVQSWLLTLKHMKLNRLGYWNPKKQAKTNKAIKKRNRAKLTNKEV